jgi:hypothetical protein
LELRSRLASSRLLARFCSRPMRGRTPRPAIAPPGFEEGVGRGRFDKPPILGCSLPTGGMIGDDSAHGSRSIEYDHCEGEARTYRGTVPEKVPRDPDREPVERGESRHVSYRILVTRTLPVQGAGNALVVDTAVLGKHATVVEHGE